MYKNSKIPKKEALLKIWAQVPVDYYEFLNIGQRIWHTHKWNLFKNLLTSRTIRPRSILEVGCSSGHLTYLLSELYPQAGITGVDVYASAIREARKRHRHITFLVADAHTLPFPDNSFDLVLCSETIEHVVDPERVLHEISRVLTYSGHAIIEMDSGSLPFRIIWWIWTHFGKGKVWKDAHLHPFKASELEDRIISNGFSVKDKMFSHLGMAVTFVVSKRRK